jgi:hypothetical protein
VSSFVANVSCSVLRMECRWGLFWHLNDFFWCVCSTHVNGSFSLKVKDSTQSPLKQALPGGRNGGLRERALNSRASTKLEHINGSRKMAALNKDTNSSIVSHSSTRSTRQQSEQASGKTVCVVKREALKPNTSPDRIEAIVKRNNETLMVTRQLIRTLRVNHHIRISLCLRLMDSKKLLSGYVICRRTSGVFPVTFLILTRC